MSHDSEITAHRFASVVWKEDIVGAPAMIMALGVFLLYPGRYLAQQLAPHDAAETVVHGFTLLLGAFGLFMMVKFIMQLRRDRTVLWDYTPNHFRIGTWVAGANVLGSSLSSVSLIVARLLHLLGWTLWLLYMLWLIRMVFGSRLVSANLSGTAFLTTVATQSLVVTFVRVYPEYVSTFMYGLISLNVLGIVFYWISFALVWVGAGMISPLINWTPQNNVTHGALAISMLAAQMIEDHMPGALPYFHFVIQAAWVLIVALVLMSVGYEVHLLIKKRDTLLRFQMTNYARNFTYGMLFACSFYGYTYAHPSIMKTALTPAILFVLALLILAVNVWELSRQIETSLHFKESIAR